MRCVRCRAKPEIHLRAHNSAFCRPCFLDFFRRQVERAIAREHMFTPDERILIAVSGGKDSLALWDVLVTLGYDTAGFHLAQGIGAYSAQSQRHVEAFARARDLTLLRVDLAHEGEGGGLDIPTVAGLTNRSPCAACGKLKRHYFDKVALEGGFDVLATGHNLDDEAARLLGNVLRWQREHLARQQPVLAPNHPNFVRKVKPLYLLSEYETAAYAFMRGLDYVVDECPNSAGATQLVYKDALARLEAASPGTKLAFLRGFLRDARAAFAEPEPEATGPGQCDECGMPAYGRRCSRCALVHEVEAKRARAARLPS
jgi:uncharacterized protein (TIGR00269 family)